MNLSAVRGAASRAIGRSQTSAAACELMHTRPGALAAALASVASLADSVRESLQLEEEEPQVRTTQRTLQSAD